MKNSKIELCEHTGIICEDCKIQLICDSCELNEPIMSVSYGENMEDFSWYCEKCYPKHENEDRDFCPIHGMNWCICDCEEKK